MLVEIRQHIDFSHINGMSCQPLSLGLLSYALFELGLKFILDHIFLVLSHMTQAAVQHYPWGHLNMVFYEISVTGERDHLIQLCQTMTLNPLHSLPPPSDNKMMTCSSTAALMISSALDS